MSKLGAKLGESKYRFWGQNKPEVANICTLVDDGFTPVEPAAESAESRMGSPFRLLKANTQPPE